jgi:ABC-2 type transport system ATP-binding protein
LTEPVLLAQGITKRFGETTALAGVGFSVGPGEVYGLIGPDGAGKTTTLRILAGLIGADSGAVAVLGWRIPGEEGRVRGAMGYMPQQYSLYGDLTVEENLRFFAGMYGVGRAELQERGARLLGIARLERFRGRLAGALSGGMYKKLALACALIHAPRVLLLDEPTNGVDPISRRELWQFLQELVREGVGVIVSTPYMDEAERCDRVGLLVGGRLVADGTPCELKQQFHHRVFELSFAERASPSLFASLRGVEQAYAVGRRLHVVVSTCSDAELRAHAVQGGSVVTAMTVVAPSFEDIFMRLASASPQAEPPS